MDRQRTRRRWAVGWAGALLAVLAGCGGGGTDTSTPEALFASFDAAMRASQWERAADLVDYGAQAGAENEDLDTAAQGQQKLITARMRDATIAGLQTWGWPADGLTPGVTQNLGACSMIEASGGGLTVNLLMAQGAEGWRIVGGVPGMLAGP